VTYHAADANALPSKRAVPIAAAGRHRAARYISALTCESRLIVSRTHPPAADRWLCLGLTGPPVLHEVGCQLRHRDPVELGQQ
jgi:hypothetical protein